MYHILLKYCVRTVSFVYVRRDILTIFGIHTQLCHIISYSNAKVEPISYQKPKLNRILWWQSPWKQPKIAIQPLVEHPVTNVLMCNEVKNGIGVRALIFDVDVDVCVFICLFVFILCSRILESAEKRNSEKTRS